MLELLTETRFCSCVDPILSYAKRSIVTRKGTISIGKTNSLDYTYLGYRLRADQKVAPIGHSCLRTDIPCVSASGDEPIYPGKVDGWRRSTKAKFLAIAR